MNPDCPECDPPVGIICPAHCLGVHCRDGEHTDLCVGPGRLPLAEAYHRRGASPALVAQIAEAERAANELLRSM